MAKKRKNLSKALRFRIFERDGFTCCYCGGKPPNVVLQIDHVLALANGGTDDETNLITACSECNLGKSDRELTTSPESRSQQIEREIAIREQVEAYNKFLMRHRKRVERWVSDLGCYWHNKYRDEKDAFVFAGQREASIRTFLRMLPTAQIMEAMDIAHSRFPVVNDDSDRTWRYFCGVCWKMAKAAEGNA